mgnify:CR=1 FL=1
MTGIEWSVVAGTAGAIALVNWWFFAAGRTVAAAVPAMPAAAPGGATAVPEVVIVVDGGYAPNTVRAKAGQPLRLVFDRRDDSSCSEEVVIPALGVRTYLPTGERTAVTVTPTEAGRIPFTCGMGMLRGTILVDA